MTEPDLMFLIISGYYSDWFFNVFMTNVTLALKNNLALLMVVTFYLVKFSKLTKNTWDDKIANWLRNKVTGNKENGGVVPRKPPQPKTD